MFEFGAAVRKPVHPEDEPVSAVVSGSCCLACAAADIPHAPKVSALGTSDTRRSEKLHTSTAL